MADLYRDSFEKFDLGSHFVTSANREAKAIVNRFNNKEKIPTYHFGGSAQKERYKGKITKEEYKKRRNMGLFSEGEFGHKGNRYFELDISNNQIIYKRSRKQHIPLKINQWVPPKQREILEALFLASENKETPISYLLKDNRVCISYDERAIEKYLNKHFKCLKSNRVLGLDLNPNFIGLSVIEFDKEDNFKVIHKEVVELTELNEQPTNKVNFEIEQIDCQIVKLCDYFKCSKLVVEDLKFSKSNKFWSKKLNRLCRNKFRYSKIKSHLQTLCSVYGVEFVEVNAAYSSVIGNFKYGDDTTPDMVAASIEIARRGYKKFSKGWFYPTLVSSERVEEVLMNRRKKDSELNFGSWKELSNQIKKSKIMYRFQLDGSKVVSRKFHEKTYTETFVFV